MIIFVLVHKNLRKTIRIVKTGLQSLEVKKIYIILSKDTSIDNEDLVKLHKQNLDKIIFYKHKELGIKGAWLMSMKIAVKENSDFIIFENDIVPSNFFFKYAKSCFSFYRNQNFFFGLTGYAPKNITKIKNINHLDTFLSHRSCSWSFGSNPKIVNYFFDFIKKNNSDKIGKILLENKSKIGGDIYEHYLLDQETNKYLIGYIWIAFMVKNNGFFVFPSEHLVSFYGNDGHGVNHSDDGKSIISECDEKFSKATIINFKSMKKNNRKDNNLIVNYWNPNILQRIFRKLINIYKKI